MSKLTRRIILAVMVVVVLVPLVPLVLWSFSIAWPFGQPLPALSLHAWAQALGDKTVIAATKNSFLLSITVVALSLVLSFFAAKNLGTRSFKGKRAVQLLLLIPSFIPQISIVFGMQKVFSQLGLYSSFAGVVVALLVFYVPYMTLLLSASFESYDLDYERQAQTLGVGKWHILWHVTVPALRSGIIVACVFGFIGSWSAYLITSAIAAPTFKTLPLLLFPMISSGTNGFAVTAAIIIMYIVPVLVVLAFFSRALAQDANHTNREGML